MWVVDASDVTVRLGGEPVLDGIDLGVEEAKISVVMGPNGVGKTVLLSCLAGSLRPDEGGASLFGHAPRDVRHRFRFMLDDGLSDPALTGRENLAFHADLHPRWTDRWRDFAETLGIADALDRPVHEYSKGMRKKLDLVITLSADVQLYLLDEPTAELDLAAVDRLHTILRELRAEGRTVVLTSHRPVDASAADDLAFLREGGVVARASPGELLDHVPPVVRVEGGLSEVFDLLQADGQVDELRDLVRDGKLLEAGAERRGFLAEGVAPATVEQLLPAASLATATVEQPRVSDLFNYYVHFPDAAVSTETGQDDRYQEDLELQFDDPADDPAHQQGDEEGYEEDLDLEESLD
ncbi:ABC transporter ATP-binding protein [Haloarchaeobius sp. TZWSO28]|uniref:ABC transporter ATP-binding protein n=1 Tax=Haloarchaeobius sp. TZWSO28 TaxID=3446119 RepID=UPI003EBEC7B9